ncbi:hypothetical protein BU23DRAFT_112915 [Bimuria novae-zelandiae CBS 107.79]|uniref:2EXR domain-containing protein n=1 Tax=Bimuria novae-zelandiae CBS 107.79 TaxID=1447943 RepID=A0A6A5VC22_9PLEO|nr:hypothetical protein BU23DRAFT_112915 [Bimuria novae-zelandiae CBS 107.79]
MPFSYRRNEADPSIESLEIASRNSHQSPLLRLPAELRMKIYEFALAEGTVKVEMVNPPGSIYALTSMACRVIRVVSKERNLLALLYVCRQVNHEAYLIPFKVNRFKGPRCFLTGDAQEFRFTLVGQPSKGFPDQRPYMDITPYL